MTMKPGRSTAVQAVDERGKGDCRLDHLVVAVRTLEEGLDYCEAVLGIRPPPGGQHARMGTHNHLLRLGQGVYLEVIAVDPLATPPDRPRWFGMDSAPMRARLARGPYLATFVARTGALAAAVGALPESGEMQAMQRGDLHWNITIRPDGMMPEGGTLPPLIEWPAGIDPTAAMPDSGCRLAQLEVRHPQPARLIGKWRCIGLDRDPSIVVLPAHPDEQPYLVAHIDTPGGRRQLSGKDETGSAR
jgi:hypothetical protein